MPTDIEARVAATIVATREEYVKSGDFHSGKLPLIIPKAIINIDKKIKEFFGTLKMLSDKAGTAVLNKPRRIPTNITCNNKLTNNEYFFSDIMYLK